MTIVPRLAAVGGCGGVELVDKFLTQYWTSDVVDGFWNWLKRLALESAARLPLLKILSNANWPPRKFEPKPFLWETTDLKIPLDFVDEEDVDDFEELLPEEVLGPDWASSPRDDCIRVFTTSRGHVMAVPVVPPTAPPIKWIAASRSTNIFQESRRFLLVPPLLSRLWTASDSNSRPRRQDDWSRR